MRRFNIPPPVSGGILLSYKCSSKCKHCMYACSPDWQADWLGKEDAIKIFTQLSDKIQRCPYGRGGIGINFGLHFTGGEPFLNFNLLLEVVKMADEFGIPSTFVETNCFWCTDDKTTKEKLHQLKDTGLGGVLISVNPFILEHVPFERTERAVRLSQQIFHNNVIIYQEYFYLQFKEFKIKNTMSLKEFLQKAPDSLFYVELLPMGRVPYALGNIYDKYPACKFFGRACNEELTRQWHIHIDNYYNYMPGYCGGISLGDARDLSYLLEGINLENFPILRALMIDIKKLYEIGTEEFNYKEQSEGYVSKCHLCVDIRKHIARQSDDFKELKPREFYYHL